MADEKFLMVSLEDERAKKIADILGNKTSKKILDFLAETSEGSEKDISKALEIPINTVEYNIKKLLQAGLVEKGKYWWSVKGRKIDMYKLAKKHIIISHKSSKPSISKLKSIFPAVIISGIVTFGLYFYSAFGKQQIIEKASDGLLEKSGEIAGTLSQEAAESVSAGTNAFVGGISGFPIWLWFLLGSLVAILIFTILNWKKL